MKSRTNILEGLNIAKVSGVDQAIIDYVNNNPEKFLNMNIKEFSQAVNAGTSSVSRFVQKCGYKDFKRFQFDVYARTIEWSTNYNESDNNAPLMDTFSDVKASTKYALDRTLNDINLAQISSIVDDIRNAGKIFAFGMGSSFLAAEEFLNSFMKIDKNVLCVKSFDEMLFALPSLSKDRKDIAILFSKSGVTKEIKFFIKELIKRGIKTILVTGNKEVKYDSKYFVRVDFKSGVKSGLTTESSAKIAELTLVDLLFLAYLDKYKDAEVFFKKQDEITKSWDEFRN